MFKGIIEGIKANKKVIIKRTVMIGAAMVGLKLLAGAGRSEEDDWEDVEFEVVSEETDDDNESTEE